MEVLDEQKKTSHVSKAEQTTKNGKYLAPIIWSSWDLGLDIIASSLYGLSFESRQAHKIRVLQMMCL